MVIVSGYSTLVGVNIDPEDEHLKIGDGSEESDFNIGLWFDGDFGEATEDEYLPEDDDDWHY
jgi:hypothetical protein